MRILQHLTHKLNRTQQREGKMMTNDATAKPQHDTLLGLGSSDGLGPTPKRGIDPHATVTGRLGDIASFRSTRVRKGDAIYTEAELDDAVAAERERPRQVIAYMATNREGEMRFTDSPDAARELEGYGWAITPLADAGPNAS